MNVLLTCAGRRNYLVQYFRQALVGRGLVFAADCCASAPALGEADGAFIVPPVSHLHYIDHLLDLCREQGIGLLISLNDLELPLLARYQGQFRVQGTTVVVSSPDVIDICFDKWRTLDFLEGCGLVGPRTYLSLDAAGSALEAGELVLPLILKPRWGSASIGLVQVEHAEDLAPAYRFVRQQLACSLLAGPSARDLSRSVLIQQRLDGQEYGLDVVNDLDGCYVTTFVRQKLTMRAGETDRAITRVNAELEQIGATIGRRLGHVGNLDCDIFVGANGSVVLELNPRFGGGYPFSHVAGANLPAALVAWADNQPARPEWLRIRPDVLAAKCDRLVVISA